MRAFFPSRRRHCAYRTPLICPCLAGPRSGSASKRAKAGGFDRLAGYGAGRALQAKGVDLLVLRMVLDRVLEETVVLSDTPSGMTNVTTLLVVNKKLADEMRAGTRRVVLPSTKRAGRAVARPSGARGAAARDAAGADPIEIESDPDDAVPGARGRSRAGDGRAAPGAVRADGEFVDLAVQKLNDWRVREAAQAGLNPDVIFLSRELLEIARANPSSADQYRAIRLQGRGHVHMKRYEAKVLAVLNRAR